MDINDLVKISARAWALTILARMHRGVPGRQAALMRDTGASRTAFGQSLSHLVELGLLERNPGNGHPLRPEVRLTARGKAAAVIAHQIDRAAPQTAQNTLIRRSWTVPVLAVSATPQYFTDIKSALDPISDRALSQSLRQLQSEAWLYRKIDGDVHPPRTLYHAIGPGLGISKAALGQL